MSLAVFDTLKYRFANNSCRRDWRSLFNNRNISKKWKGQPLSNLLFCRERYNTKLHAKIENLLKTSSYLKVMINTRDYYFHSLFWSAATVLRRLLFKSNHYWYFQIAENWCKMAVLRHILELFYPKWGHYSRVVTIRVL